MKLVRQHYVQTPNKESDQNWISSFGDDTWQQTIFHYDFIFSASCKMTVTD
jgi:hypothetical protein